MKAPKTLIRAAENTTQLADCRLDAFLEFQVQLDRRERGLRMNTWTTSKVVQDFVRIPGGSIRRGHQHAPQMARRHESR